MAGRHRKQHAVRPHAHRGRHRKPASRQRAVLPTVVIVAVLAVGGVVFSRAIAQGQPPREAVAAPRQPVVVPTVIPSPTQPTRPPAVTKARHHHHHHPAAPALRIRDVGGPCYVEISRHGQLLTRRILRPGQQVVVRRGGVDVVFGNAGAVRMSIHGHSAHRAGRSGQVRTLRVH